MIWRERLFYYFTYYFSLLFIIIIIDTNTNSGIVDITRTIRIAAFVTVQCLWRIQVLAPEKEKINE